MYHGKHIKKANKKPMASLLLLVLALLSASTVGTWAYLRLASDPATNTFAPAESVSPEIHETFYNNVKSNVSVNVGETGYSVYVRAQVIVTWQDSDGNVHITPPVKGTDYSVSYNETDWKQNSDDGCWYYQKAVNSGEETRVLINECRPLKAAPIAGYTLNVKIIAQTIQSAGSTDDGDVSAIQNAWNNVISS